MKIIKDGQHTIEILLVAISNFCFLCDFLQESGVEAFLTNDFTTGAKKAVELAKA